MERGRRWQSTEAPEPALQHRAYAREDGMRLAVYRASKSDAARPNETIVRRWAAATRCSARLVADHAIACYSWAAAGGVFGCFHHFLMAAMSAILDVDYRTHKAVKGPDAW
eukprot:495691-Prymnesium_polylepis.1